MNAAQKPCIALLLKVKGYFPRIPNTPKQKMGFTLAYVTPTQVF